MTLFNDTEVNLQQKIVLMNISVFLNTLSRVKTASNILNFINVSLKNIVMVTLTELPSIILHLHYFKIYYFFQKI
jgi:hypothetical protein